jgi:hypothetical protein
VSVSQDGEGPTPTPTKTPDSIELFRGRPVFACPRRSKRSQKSSKQASSASPSPAQSADESEAEEAYAYFTNGQGGELVALDEAGNTPLIPPYGPDRDQEYHPIRLYHVDGITWAVCDDCALQKFPRGFEGSKIVARVGCAYCFCKNAIQSEAMLKEWLARGRPWKLSTNGVTMDLDAGEIPPRGA